MIDGLIVVDGYDMGYQECTSDFRYVKEASASNQIRIRRQITGCCTEKIFSAKIHRNSYIHFTNRMSYGWTRILYLRPKVRSGYGKAW